MYVDDYAFITFVPEKYSAEMLNFEDSFDENNHTIYVTHLKITAGLPQRVSKLTQGRWTRVEEVVAQ